AVAIKKTATVVPKTDQKAVKLSDRITYTYLVTNTGNVDLVKIAVSDPSLGAVDCPIPVPPGLAPGASETCRGEIQHVVSKKDITAGHIQDTATATSTDSSGQTSSNSSPSTATVDSAHATKKPKPKGRLTLTKTASDSQPTGGQDVTYTLTVHDPTAVAVRDVKVCDELPDGLLEVSSSPHASRTGSSFCWTVRRLSAHASRQLHLTANVARVSGGTITNHATATGKGVKTAHASATIHAKPAPISPCATASRARLGHAGPIAHAAC